MCRLILACEAQMAKAVLKMIFSCDIFEWAIE
jgi:hypothetical protein